MKDLLAVTAAIEAGAGVALLWYPSATVRLLLGDQIDAAPSPTIVRWIGAALLALGIACWLASRGARGRFARGMVTTMTVYNPVAALALAAAGLIAPSPGVLLWPAVALHAAMALWCLGCILKPASSPKETK